MLALLLSSALAAERPADLDAAIRSFEQTTGVDLHVMGDRSEPDGRIPPSMGPVDPTLARRALPHLEEVLLKYPASVRGGLLQDLHLFGKFQPGGKPYNGMSRPDYGRIDLAVRPRTSLPGLKSTLDHEIGHLIEFQDDFPEQEWLALSTGYAGRLDQQQETKNQEREVWLEQGFVSRYASKNRHEDFAEMAQLAFTQPGRLKAWAEEHPALAKKVELMTRVYRDTAPGMPLPWVDGEAPVAAAPPPEPPTRPGRGRPSRDDKGNRMPR